MKHMEVRITEDGEDYNEKIDIVLSDNDLDNRNFVDLILCSKNEDYETGEKHLANVSVSVEDLYRAAKLFNEQRLEAKRDRE